MTAQTLDKLSKHNKSATAKCRGHKNSLEFVYIKYSIFKKMPTTKDDKLHTYKVTVIFFIDFVFVLFKQSCTYLELEIMPCMPTAQGAFSKYHIYIYGCTTTPKQRIASHPVWASSMDMLTRQ